MVVVAFLAVGAAGCGSASSTSTTTSRSTSTTSTTAKQASARPAAPVVPAGSVALVASTPITQAAFNHWAYVAAKSQTSQTPGAPVIVPDPPDYKSCIAQVRKTLPTFRKKSAKTLGADCRELFHSLSSQVMDFLIRADWIQADGARHGIVPTDAQVERALNTARKKQFPTASSFHSFLAKTGQSLQDIRFRFRINLIIARLTAREKGSATAKQTAVSKREKRLFAGQTRCTPLVLMADCGNYRAG
jgi:hypothetical protein